MSSSQSQRSHAAAALVSVSEEVLAWHAAGCWIGGLGAAVLGAVMLFKWLCGRRRPGPVIPTCAPPRRASPASGQSAPPAASPASGHMTHTIELGDGVGAAIAAANAAAGFCAIM
jgi:hypothetical protein